MKNEEVYEGLEYDENVVTRYKLMFLSTS